MKKITSSILRWIRGQSTAVLLSVALHALIVLLASVFVVFNIVKKEEKKFEPPPPVERPKMKLKKPRVKMKKQTQPRVSQRIVAKTVVNMPDIQLPDVSGVGTGMGTGIDGYELMPDMDSLSIFGGAKSLATGNEFEGVFYSLAYDRQGNDTAVTETTYPQIMRKFVESGWNPYVFAPYYRSAQKLYTTQIFIPTTYSEFGPSAFGIQDGPDFDPYLWCVHYKGKIAHDEGGTFRFWGLGDDVLIVRVNGEIVLDASYNAWRGEMTDWKPTSDQDWKYFIGHAVAAVGTTFELEAGEPVEMEVLIGEIPGERFCAYLLIEDESVDYDENRDGMPVLPVFKTAEIPDRVKDKIKYTLIPGEGDLDAELKFNVY